MKHQNNPTSTVLQSRTAMFLPTCRANGETDIEVINSHGKITLRKCRLTQTHRNIIDCIFSYYAASTLPDGSVVFTFTMHDLLSKLGHKTLTNHGWLTDKFDDMREASVMLESINDDVQIVSYQGILHEHRKSNRLNGKKGANGKDQYLYAVRFTPNFMKMFAVDMNVYSAKVTHKIIALKHSVTQALVREVISHRTVNRDLDELLNGIGVNATSISERNYRERRADIISETETLLNEFGIDVKDMRNGKVGVFYKQHEDIFFRDPLKTIAKNQADLFDVQDGSDAK